MAIKTATVLAFERKLANSDAVMYAGSWQQRVSSENWQPIAIQSKEVRGTTSHRLKNANQSDPAKLDAERQNANLQRVDVAALPFDTDTLKVTFSLRVLGNLAQPSACSDQDYQAALAAVINGYVSENGFNELAVRYATNIANGRFLWRNRVGAEAVEVHVKHIKNQAVQSEWVFAGEDFDLRSFSKTTTHLAELAEVIRQGLSGEAFAFLQVEAFVRLGTGQEVFPSQELMLDIGNDNKHKKSKTLYQVSGVAAMHSQKIGNALRTIDTWYPEAAELGPIAVEPYGSVTNRGKAYRTDKIDFYTLLDGWVVKGQIPPVEQQHYVMATLLRGGVFGEKSE